MIHFFAHYVNVNYILFPRLKKKEIKRTQVWSLHFCLPSGRQIGKKLHVCVKNLKYSIIYEKDPIFKSKMFLGKLFRFTYFVLSYFYIIFSPFVYSLTSNMLCVVCGSPLACPSVFSCVHVYILIPYG